MAGHFADAGDVEQRLVAGRHALGAALEFAPHPEQRRAALAYQRVILRRHDEHPVVAPDALSRAVLARAAAFSPLFSLRHAPIIALPDGF